MAEATLVLPPPEGPKVIGACLKSYSFWARRIWLARTTWQRLLLPEELEDGRDQTRVQKLLSQKDLVGVDRLAKAALT
jgi:hypothetical protein